MLFRKYKVFLLSGLFLSSLQVCNAQIASNELILMTEDSQSSPKQEVISLEEEMEERIERGDLLTPMGASAYDIYKEYTENNPSDHSLKRKLKRTLVAALVDASDKTLIEYFEEGGDFILKYISTPSNTNQNVPIDAYYFVAADLLGEDNFLNGSLISKGYFIEALKFQYVEKIESETVKKKLKESIDLDPNASYTYNELGLIYLYEGNYGMACESFNLAIKLNSYWETPKEKLKMAEAAMIESKN